MNHAPYLKKNDLVTILAPAGYIKDEQPILAAKKWLTSVGLNVFIGKNTLGKKGIYAGSDKERLEDFQSAIDNPDVKAIWAVRGGYGAMKIMDQLDFTKFMENPKWIVGFSDITAFHNQIHTLGFESIHGIMPVQFTHNSLDTKLGLDTLHKALFGQKLSYKIENSPYNRKGNVEGILIGGNLSLQQSLLGTPYELNTRNKILFIEDVGEYAYRIDRMLQSLKLAGTFEHLAGLIVGGFTDIKDQDIPYGKSYQKIILEATKRKKFPILFDFPAGHFPDNRALILGRNTQLSVNEAYSAITFQS